MAETYNAPSIDEYLRKRLMPVEGAIPHVQGIEMYGNSIPAGAVGGDLFEYINFQQRYVSGLANFRVDRLLRKLSTNGVSVKSAGNAIHAPKSPCHLRGSPQGFQSNFSPVEE
jgi:hypothetical protein